MQEFTEIIDMPKTELIQMKVRITKELQQYNGSIKIENRINRDVLSGINNCFRIIKNVNELLGIDVNNKED